MSLANNYNNALRKELRAYAAWVPGSNTFQLGDYGKFRNGIFEQLGNIEDEFNVNLKVKKGQQGQKLVFTSDSVRSFAISGGAEIPVASLPDSGASAELKFVFEKANSISLAVDPVFVDELGNEAEIARKLAENDKWDHRYKVVSHVFHGKAITLLGTENKNTEVSIKGKASALKAVANGNAEVGLDLQFSKAAKLSLVGGEGCIALKFFQVKRRGGVKVSRDANGDVEFTKVKDFGETPVDDDF